MEESLLYLCDEVSGENICVASLKEMLFYLTSCGVDLSPCINTSSVSSISLILIESKEGNFKQTFCKSYSPMAIVQRKYLRHFFDHSVSSLILIADQNSV